MPASHVCFSLFVARIQVTTAVCNPVDPAQSLSYSAASKQIVHSPSGLCLDASVPAVWCSVPPQSAWLVCNPLAAIDDRSADIVSRMSLADKIQALATGAPALPSINLPAYNWWSEATHGISHVSYTASTPYASNTGLPITTGASFNRSLWYATANQIAREARAFMNQGNAYSTYWVRAPCTVSVCFFARAQVCFSALLLRACRLQLSISCVTRVGAVT
jgi:hypothetical protein